MVKAKTKPKSKPKAMVATDTYRSKRATQKRKTITGSTVKTRKRMQTGGQNASGRAGDNQQKARYPGRRVSANGSKYTETRRNRSDASKLKKR